MEARTRFCTYCGDVVHGTPKYCGSCGKPIEWLSTDIPSTSPTTVLNEPTSPHQNTIASVPITSTEKPVPVPRSWQEIRMPLVLAGGVGMLLLLIAIAASSFAVSAGSENSTIIYAYRGTVIPKNLRPTPQPGPDADGDWVSDQDEEKYGTDASLWDSDDDGLTDFEEIFVFLTDPTVADKDQDGDLVPDALEANLLGTDPTQKDTDRDGDGLPDSFERQNGSDPGLVDTDGDLLSDMLEIYLTRTNPDAADPIESSGFPQALIAWLPQQLQNSTCRISASMSMDQLVITDPEEADGNDIILGDESYMYYGMWRNAQDWSDLDFDFSANRYSGYWEAERLMQGDTITRFPTVSELSADCGDSITWAVVAYESDAPWGGTRYFGLWRDERSIIFHRIPLEWSFVPTAMYFSGTGGDSATFRYDINYTPGVNMIP